MRTSFTSVVREAGDLSAGLFDRRGRMAAQAVTGTPATSTRWRRAPTISSQRTRSRP